MNPLPKKSNIDQKSKEKQKKLDRLNQAFRDNLKRRNAQAQKTNKADKA